MSYDCDANNSEDQKYTYKLDNYKETTKPKFTNADNRGTMSSKNKETNNLEKTINELVNKSMSKYEKTIKPKDFFDNTDSKVLNFELEHLKQENIKFRSDTIIQREEITKLNEIGVNLENELEFSRKKK